MKFFQKIHDWYEVQVTWAKYAINIVFLALVLALMFGLFKLTNSVFALIIPFVVFMVFIILLFQLGGKNSRKSKEDVESQTDNSNRRRCFNWRGLGRTIFLIKYMAYIIFGLGFQLTAFGDRCNCLDCNTSKKMIGIIVLCVGAALIGFAKSISDTVDHSDNWQKSWFSKFDKKSFFGPKDETWERKHKYKNKSKVLNYLFTTWLVWTTDIWHFMQTAQNLFVVCVLLYFIPLWWYVFFYILLRALFFHVFYTWIWPKSK